MKKEKNITLRVTEEFAKILKDYAKKRFMSQANLVEYLVKKEIENESDKKNKDLAVKLWE